MISFFEKIIDVLDEINIPFMLSGSVAMGIYVLPRATRDFDFIVHLEPINVGAFVEQFKVGYYCDEDAVKDAIAHKSIFNIIDHESGYKADFVVLKDEAFRQEEFKRRHPVELFGKKIYIVTVEDLLISKLIWIQDIQSAIQIEDIKQLANVKEIDMVYIKNWTKQLKLNTFDII